MFPAKWRARGQAEAVNYFLKTWTGKPLIAWGRSYLYPGMPATNNGLERKNRTVKDLQAHKRLPLSEFVDQLPVVLRTEEALNKTVATEPELGAKEWRQVQVTPYINYPRNIHSTLAR